MKIKSLVIATLASVVSTAAFAGSAASAESTETSFFEAPVPVKVVQPVQIPSHHESTELTLTMTIDENGKPRNVEVASKTDQEAYKRLRATVAQWRFKPARKNGENVPAKVVLPLEVTGL